MQWLPKSASRNVGGMPIGITRRVAATARNCANLVSISRSVAAKADSASG